MPTIAHPRESIATGADALERVADVWLRLWQQTEPPPPMLELAWVREWWRSHRREGDPFLVVVADAAGVPVGLAPLYIRRARLDAAGSLRTVHFLGTGEHKADEVHGEHTGWLGPARYGSDVSGAVARALSARCGSWDRISLQYLWPDRGIAAELPDLLGPLLIEHRVTRTPTFRSPALPLDEYIARMPSKKMRSNCHRGLNVMRAEGIEFVRAASTADALAMLDALAELHQRRWRKRGVPGAFASVSFNDFHRRMLARYGKEKPPWIVGLRHRQRWIAVEYHLSAGDRLYDYIGGLETTTTPAALSPGLVVHLLAIDAAATNGLRTYDFLGGGYEHKRRLALDEDELLTLDCLQSNLRVRLWRQLRDFRRAAASRWGEPHPIRCDDADEGTSVANEDELIATAAEPASVRTSEQPLAIAAAVADVILAGAIVFFAFQLAFALQLHRPAVFGTAYAVIIALAVAARLFGAPSHRVNAALLIAPVIAGLLAYETYAAARRPRDGTAAWLAGRTFDSRDLWEVLKDERKKDPSTVSYIIPRALLTHHLVLEHWEPEAVARVVQPNWGIVVDGTQVLPLSGISNRRTVFGNESGTRIIYDSDERGFNNPRGIWSSGHVQIAIVGDSYSQGAAVAPEAITAAHIRKRYPGTLTLGMCANGPLMEYASLKEHVVDVKPPIVLWAYYMNDLSDLEVEKGSKLLWRYLDEDDFRQGLAAQQEKIDAALGKYLNDLEQRTPPRWPVRLDAVGLTRNTTPLWLQDLVTTDQHSSISAFLRLDGMSWFVTKHFIEEQIYDAPPDYDLFERILRQARDVAASWGGRLYFVYLPAVQNLDPRHRYLFSREPVLALVNRLGIPLIDLHEFFLTLPDPERLRFHYESHANEAGYALHGKLILEALEAARATPSGPPPPPRP